ncbi:ribonuclease t2-like protein [Acrodontium crateriforme]|uniref:Ribonuclease T2-like n=1 Tax=Acrodontium crateriforme TaxID=150365 RepID=A0AAQ3RCM7_9PEZI|nr:ribonuclease t2-like protein [Acrodontium crateriforme]
MATHVSVSMLSLLLLLYNPLAASSLSPSAAVDHHNNINNNNNPDDMASSRSAAFALAALGSAQAALAMGFDAGIFERASASCSSPQLSCHNTTAVQNLCCFNSPGGALLQTQFWDTSPQTGPVDSWTIHGLWPDNCDGTYQANCDADRAYTNITQILQAFGQDDLLSYMQTYWPDYQGNDESFWEHEWAKHGTCISTLDPNCYTNYQPTQEVPDFFNKVVTLFKSLPTYQWLSDAGITPSSSKTYTLSQIQTALSKQHGGQVYIGCASGALDEIWYFYNVKGSVQTGTFVPTDIVGSNGKCPSSGIKYLPKTGSSSPTSTAASSTTTISTGTTPTGTGGSLSGTGYINVLTSGTQKGCLISAGTWYTTGTCATYTATPSSNGFTLKSSKGSCGISNGAFTCGSSVSATVFGTDSSGQDVEFNGSPNFYADSVPSGSTQVTVYTSSSHSTLLQLQWQGK